MTADESMSVRLPRDAMRVVDMVRDRLQDERGGRWGRGEAVRELAQDWLRRNKRRSGR